MDVAGTQRTADLQRGEAESMMGAVGDVWEPLQPELWFLTWVSLMKEEQLDTMFPCVSMAPLGLPENEQEGREVR